MCDQLLLHLGQQELPSGVASNALVSSESEVLCLAICNQARLHAGQGLAEAAADILRLARQRFPPLSKHAKVRGHKGHSFANTPTSGPTRPCSVDFWSGVTFHSLFSSLSAHQLANLLFVRPFITSLERSHRCIQPAVN